MVETWLGEGGYELPPEGWFRYLRELCDHWRERYDWRALEDRLNMRLWLVPGPELPPNGKYVSSSHFG